MIEPRFSKIKNSNGYEYYVAEVTVNADYALHLEREGKGFFRIGQRFTDSGKYAEANIPYELTGTKDVIEFVARHGVYPLHLCIMSSTEVTTCVIKEVQ